MSNKEIITIECERGDVDRIVINIKTGRLSVYDGDDMPLIQGTVPLEFVRRLINGQGC